MYTLFRTVGLLLAVLFLFLILQGFRVYFGTSICNALGPWGVDVPSQVLMIANSFVSLVIFCWLLFSAQGKNVFWGLLLLSGGLSNLFERFTFGCVMDYLHVFSWFPVFNMADVFLTIAVIGFLWENKSESFK